MQLLLDKHTDTRAACSMLYRYPAAVRERRHTSRASMPSSAHDIRPFGSTSYATLSARLLQESEHAQDRVVSPVRAWPQRHWSQAAKAWGNEQSNGDEMRCALQMTIV